MMNRNVKGRWWVMLMSGAMLVGAGAGCGKIADKIAEKAAEKAAKEIDKAIATGAVPDGAAPGTPMGNALAAAPAKPAEDKSLNYMVDASSVKAAYKEKIGGPVRLFEAIIYPPMGQYVGTRFMAEVQNPTKKLEADKYTLQGGTWGETQPIKWMGKMPTEKDLEAQSFDLDTVDLALIPKMTADALAQLKYDNGTVTHIILKKNFPFEKDLRWFVYVNSERRSGYVLYNYDGKFVKKME